MMDAVDEHRVCVKFSINLGKNFIETSRLLQQAFRDEAPPGSTRFERFKRFMKCRISINDNVR